MRNSLKLTCHQGKWVPSTEPWASFGKTGYFWLGDSPSGLGRAETKAIVESGEGVKLLLKRWMHIFQPTLITTEHFFYFPRQNMTVSFNKSQTIWQNLTGYLAGSICDLLRNTRAIGQLDSNFLPNIRQQLARVLNGWRTCPWSGVRLTGRSNWALDRQIFGKSRNAKALLYGDGRSLLLTRFGVIQAVW